MRKVEFPHFWMTVYIRGVFCLEWWKFAEVLPAKCHSYGWASFEEKKKYFIDKFILLNLIKLHEV